MHPGAALLFSVLLVLTASGARASAAEASLALNEIQLLGSHNSYKQAMDPQNMAMLRQVNAPLAESLDYWHLPLAAQLDLGLRKLELDVFYDPAGQLFGRAGAGGSQFPVLHVQNLDDRSHCANLLHCFAQLLAWADANPGHLPLFVSFNAKDEIIDQPGFLRPEPFGEDAWMALDAELRAVVGDRLITPAEVFATGVLRWPRLADARGRFVLVLDEGGDKRRQYASRWRERAMFSNLPERAPGAAILVVNDPLTEFDRIQRLVRAGFIVRTRADADTREARTGSVERRDAAFASGAQLVSTDYYLPAQHLGGDYRVVMPGGGIARCNPLLAPGCVLNGNGVRSDLEDRDRVDRDREIAPTSGPRPDTSPADAAFP
ncbi:MAG: Ca2+-dependent phosphoinositide-specific phospholipase C [Pseudomonadales bacterium]